MSSFNKKQITSIVSRKLVDLVKSLHVYCVINILIEEMISELEKGKIINIPGFGMFELIEIKSKNAINVTTGQRMITRPTKSLRFRLADKFKEQLNNEGSQ
jgi:nucleoid DNA-binding protein